MKIFRNIKDKLTISEMDKFVIYYAIAMRLFVEKEVKKVRI